MKQSSIGFDRKLPVFWGRQREMRCYISIGNFQCQLSVFSSRWNLASEIRSDTHYRLIELVNTNA
jgi:hypothetical protein